MSNVVFNDDFRDGFSTRDTWVSIAHMRVHLWENNR
jgi:hypothetical protein